MAHFTVEPSRITASTDVEYSYTKRMERSMLANGNKTNQMAKVLNIISIRVDTKVSSKMA